MCFGRRKGWTAGGGREEKWLYRFGRELISAAEAQRKSLYAVRSIQTDRGWYAVTGIVQSWFVNATAAYLILESAHVNVNKPWSRADRPKLK